MPQRNTLQCDHTPEYSIYLAGNSSRDKHYYRPIMAVFGLEHLRHILKCSADFHQGKPLKLADRNSFCWSRSKNINKNDINICISEPPSV